MITSEASMQSNESKLIIAKEWVTKWAPLFGFLGGFCWDSWTLGQIVTSLDLYLLTIYLLGAFGCLFLLESKVQKWAILGYHFSVGTLLSALLILYFKSAASWGSFLIIIALAVSMTLNEFVGEKKFGDKIRLMVLWWVTMMFLNFVIPHLLKSVWSLWFYLSLIISLTVIYFISKKLKILLKAPLVIAGIVLLVLWIGNFLPPVPLVLKSQFIGTDLVKEKYQAKLLYQGGFFEENLIEHTQGKPLFYLTSVFAPSGVDAKLFHKWWYQNKSDNKYKLIDNIPLHLASGGRVNGWRLFSRKSNLREGLWRLETTNESGAIISSLQFDLKLNTNEVESVNITQQIDDTTSAAGNQAKVILFQLD